MKKIISIFVIMVMILSIASTTVFASPITDGKILDIDFSSYDGTISSITESTGQDVTIEFNSTDTGKQPTVGTESLSENSTLTYAHFDNPDSQYISVKGGTNTTLFNNDTTTIQMWARIPKPEMNKYPKFFGYTSNVSGVAYSWVVEAQGITADKTKVSVFGYKGDGTTTTKGEIDSNNRGVIDSYVNEWTLYTFTREVAEGATTYKIYANGNLIATQTSDVGDTYDGNELNIGGFYAWKTSASNIFTGDISRVQIYNKAFTEAEAKAAYDEGITNYIYVTPVVDNKLLDIDLSNYDGTISSVHESTGLDFTIGFNGDYKPSVGEDILSNGNKIKYASFNADETAAKEPQYIIVSGGERPTLFNNDTTTIQMWARIPKSEKEQYPKFFGYTSNVSGVAYSWVVQAMGIKDDSTNISVFGYKGDGTTTTKGEIDSNNRGVIDSYVNKWVLYTFTREVAEGTTTYKIYANGNLIATQTSDVGDTYDGNVFSIGGSTAWNTPSNTSSFFVGDIASVQVYNRAFTENEMKSEYKNNYYKFTTGVQPEEGIILDIDFSTYDGTITSVTETTGQETTISFNSADNGRQPTVGTEILGENKAITYAHFDAANGVSQHINIEGTDNSTIFNNKITTVQMWAKIPKPDSGKYPKLFGYKGSRDVYSWVTETYTQSAKMLIKNKGSYTQSGKGDIDSSTGTIDDYANKWTLYTFTREITNTGATYKVYANGNAILTQTNANITDTLDGNLFTIGGSSAYSTDNNNGLFGGDIASVQIYNKVFTDDELKKKYEDTCDKFTAEIQPGEDESGKATITKVDYYDENDEDFTFVNGKDIVYLDVYLENTTQSDVNYAVIMATYFENKVFDTVAYRTGSVAAKTNETDTYNFDLTKVPANGKIKFFF
ncbi:MAG: LamG-like jellyroll fold domain-containing protein, partial [Clostridia bacterium]|nr:LamG-like jellyroll fold domain-containing protein [Clostridia bacterium]